MPRRVVVDSGPLVALFDRDDEHHDAASRFLKRFRGELIANVAVLTEVTYLLDFSTCVQRDFLTWVRRGGVRLEGMAETDLDRVSELVEKYADLPADFTDATLVAVCERLGILDVATIDRHFEVYRFKGKKRFRNVFRKE